MSGKESFPVLSYRVLPQTPDAFDRLSLGSDHQAASALQSPAQNLPFFKIQRIVTVQMCTIVK